MNPEAAKAAGVAAADKIAIALKTYKASEGNWSDAEKAFDLILSAFEIIMDCEAAEIRNQMQKEIDARQLEIERLTRERSAPRELF